MTFIGNPGGWIGDSSLRKSHSFAAASDATFRARPIDFVTTCALPLRPGWTACRSARG
jgi:hypothetical protein